MSAKSNECRWFVMSEIMTVHRVRKIGIAKGLEMKIDRYAALTNRGKL